MPDLDSDRLSLLQLPIDSISRDKSTATAGITPDEMADIMHIMADLEPVSGGELDADETGSEAGNPVVPREKRWVELPNGDRMPLVEYEALKARKRRNQEDCRAKRRAAVEAARPAVVRLSRAEMAADAKRFVTWAKLDGPRQRQLRPKARRYVEAHFVLLELRREMGTTPGPTVFGQRLALRFASFGQIKPAAAAQVLRQIRSLEEQGGPWER